MHTHLLYNDIWYSCTPVWNCNGTTTSLECDRQQERHEYLFLLYMSINSKDSNAANNSNGKRTAQPSEMGKYSTPELQAAFNTGREIGRTEGMLYYIKHASENMQKEAEKLNSKLQAQKAKV